MDFYRIESQTNQKTVVKHPEVYESFSDAQAALKQMMAEQGKKMNISRYITAIRKGKHRDYRREIANILKSIFSEKEPFCIKTIKQLSNTLEDFQYACREGEKEPTDNFDAWQESGSTLLFDFYFDQQLHLEFYISDETDDWFFYDYFFMKDKNGSFKANIEKAEPPAPPKEKKPNSKNLVAVYEYLRNTDTSHRPYREVTDTELQKQTEMSKETVRAHMDRLIALGLPITKSAHQKYYIDLSRINDIPNKVDASALGDGVNPLLILFVLKAASGPMRQKAVIDEVYAKYNRSIKRAAVGRNIDLLKNVYPIEKTANGYVWKQ